MYARLSNVHVIQTNEKRHQLIKELKLVPNVIPPTQRDPNCPLRTEVDQIFSSPARPYPGLKNRGMGILEAELDTLALECFSASFTYLFIDFDK